MAGPRTRSRSVQRTQRSQSPLQLSDEEIVRRIERIMRNPAVIRAAGDRENLSALEDALRGLTAPRAVFSHIHLPAEYGDYLRNLSSALNRAARGRNSLPFMIRFVRNASEWQNIKRQLERQNVRLPWNANPQDYPAIVFVDLRPPRATQVTFNNP